MQRAQNKCLSNGLLGTIAVTAVVALFIQSTGPVFGAQATTTTKSWIFTSNCDNVQTLQDYIPLQTTYVAYLGKYEVVCFPSANEPLNVNEYIKVVRSVYPNDKVVFVFDTRNPMIKEDFQLYLSTVDDYYDHSGVLGKSFIPQGYAVAALNGEVVAHELTHLTTMKGHTSVYTIDDPTQWVPYQP